MNATYEPIQMTTTQETTNETHIRWYNELLDELRTTRKSAEQTFICGARVVTYKKHGWRAGWWTMQGETVIWHSMSGYKSRAEILDAVIDSF